MKNCAFQYATDRAILVDTDLITREEADELWAKNIDNFKIRLDAGESPEMAIWIDMANNTNYGRTAKHFQADDLILQDGILYEKVEVG